MMDCRQDDGVAATTGRFDLTHSLDRPVKIKDVSDVVPANGCSIGDPDRRIDAG